MHCSHGEMWAKKPKIHLSNLNARLFEANCLSRSRHPQYPKVSRERARRPSPGQMGPTWTVLDRLNRDKWTSKPLPNQPLLDFGS